MKARGKCYDAQLFTKYQLPANQDWAEKVYRKEYFGNVQHHIQIAMPHFGCMEARMVLYGEGVVFGMALDDIPGATIRE